MKKYILVLFLFGFLLLPLSSFAQIKSVTPTAPAYPAGCTSNAGFSSTTGIPCNGTPVTSLLPGCTSTTGFSTTTGMPCNGNRITTTPAYPAGCTSNAGFSSTTGIPCNGPSAPFPVTLFADVYPLYPSLIWNNGVAKTDTFGSQQISGFEVDSNSVLSTQYYGFSQSFNNYYDTKLTALGWIRDQNISADGPGSSVWGYMKGNEVVVFSYNSTYINNVTNAPVSGLANMTFSIFSGETTNSSAFTVNSIPSGMVIGGSLKIQWNGQSGTSYNIFLENKNGLGEGTIASGVVGNSYTWQVGSVAITSEAGIINETVPAGIYEVQVVNTTGVDSTPSNLFNIVAPTVNPSPFTVTFPTAGVTLQVGQTYSLAWSNPNVNVNGYTVNFIYPDGNILQLGTAYSLGGGNIGAFSWTVPSSILAETGHHVIVIGDGYEIQFAGQNGVVGVSSPFSISSLPPSTIISAPTISSATPSSATLGSIVTVTGTNFDQNTLVYLDTDYGPAITPTILSSTSLSFVVPTYALVGNHSILVNDKGHAFPTGTSVPLNITATPSITLLSPNGGDTLQTGQSYVIKWNTSGFSPSDKVSINLKDGSINCASGIVGCWTEFGIDNVPNTGSYNWNTNQKMSSDGGPNSLSVYAGNNFKIHLQISSVNNSTLTASDYSDNSFIVVPLVPSPSSKTPLAANALNAFDSATTQSTATNTQASTCSGFTMSLSKGMNNPEVTCLQKLLEQKGFNIGGVAAGSETTYFGENTLLALEAFQSNKNLTPDGIFGSQTQVALTQ